MKESNTQETLIQSMQAIDNISDAPLNQGQMSNFGAIHKIGNEFQAVGARDITDPNSSPIDEDTMMGEGSVGKIRFAGLAYMLEEDGVIDLQQNAKEFFSSRKMTEFLEEKYPETRIQEEILKLFSGDSANATLADLTTHRSGIGDLTRDQGRHFNKMGINADYNLSVLLTPPLDNAGIPLKENIPRDSNGKPRAQSAPFIEEKDLPMAEHGAHQYSNLGYALLGVAMEGAYKAKKGKNKTYKELMNDYMLHPKEGTAKNTGLEFNSTKFPENISSSDNAVVANWRDTASDTNINANNFNGANAAGGMFTSANDSEKYFKEYFTGFPGTKEFGQSKNKFFSDEAIGRMTKEQNKFPYTDKDKDQDGNHRCQGPGFVAVINPRTKESLQYDKGGGTFGYGSKMIFHPKENIVDFKVITSENLTSSIAKEAGVKLSNVMDAYKDKDKKFDRNSCIADYNEKGAEGIKNKVKTHKLIKDLSASPKVTNYVQSFRNKSPQQNKSQTR
jgi:CubicO group peptidase (beta-lactamase class C family)